MGIVSTTPFTSKQLIAWREAMGYTQLEASQALGCARRTIINWEQSEKPPYYIGLACAALASGIAAPYGAEVSE